MLALVGHFGGFCNAFPCFRDNFTHFNPKRSKTGKNGVFSKTLSPATNTGGCVLPDITPNHTLPPNKMLILSLIDGFQHDTHCLPSHQTGNVPHSESDNVPGFCNTFVDWLKFIGFIYVTF